MPVSWRVNNHPTPFLPIVPISREEEVELKCFTTLLGSIGYLLATKAVIRSIQSIYQGALARIRGTQYEDFFAIRILVIKLILIILNPIDMVANSYEIVLFNQFQSVFFLSARRLLKVILPQLYILWFESRRLIPSNEIEH